MTPMFGLVLGASVSIYLTLGGAVKKLGEIANLLSQINEHLRIVRQHDLPETVRHLEAINYSVGEKRR